MAQILVSIFDFEERGLLSAHFNSRRFSATQYSFYAGCEDQRKLKADIVSARDPFVIVTGAITGDGDDTYVHYLHDLIRGRKVPDTAPALMLVYSSQVGLGRTYAERYAHTTDRHFPVKFVRKNKADTGEFEVLEKEARSFLRTCGIYEPA